MWAIAPLNPSLTFDPSVTDASTHFAPLSAHQTANGQSALTLIADFLAN